MPYRRRETSRAGALFWRGATAPRASHVAVAKGEGTHQGAGGRKPEGSGRRQRHATALTEKSVCAGQRLRPATGKTTTLQQLGRTFHLADRAHRGTPGDHVAVVFLSVPPAATPKMLICELARFLDLPNTSRMNHARITDIVCATLNGLGTRLVLVDDIHLLNTRTRNGAETSDQIKHLSERIPATFVYAGVAIEESQS